MKKSLSFLLPIVMLAFAIALVNCGNDTHTSGLTKQFALVRSAAGDSINMFAAQRHFQMEHRLASHKSRHMHQGSALKSWTYATTSGTDSIVLMNNDGTGELVIADQQGWFEAVQESSDGLKGVGIAEDDNGWYQVFYADLTDKKNPKITQLTTTPEDHWSPSLSWDYKKVVYVKVAMSGDYEYTMAFMMPTSGGAETQISTSFNVSYPTFTPDGKIVFEQEDNDTINIMNADGSGNTALTGDANHTYFDEYPSVSHDGKTIVFARYPSDETLGGEDIWTMNIDGTNAKQLTTDGASWDPMFVNNKIVYISWRDGTADQAYSMSLDGASQKRISNSNQYEYFDKWGW